MAGLPPGIAAAAPQPVQLSIAPTGHAGPYFQLTMNPGEHRELQVALGNRGASTVAARSYAADVYTIVNGGFGAELRGGTATGTTTWLDYGATVLTLAASASTVRTFTVAVPAGTAAGQYLTSLVIENDQPLKGGGTVALDQVVRQVIAVAIRVPGPLRPSLSIGTASHKVVAGRSVLGIAVRNSGNAHLKPTGELQIHDHSGQLVSHSPVGMDTFYAHTDTSIEVTLAKTLLPGRYTVSLSLKDPTYGTTVAAQNLPVTVAKPTDTPSSAGLSGYLPGISQSAVAGFPLRVLAAAVLMVLLAIAAVLWRRGQRGRHRRGRSASQPQP